MLLAIVDLSENTHEYRRVTSRRQPPQWFDRIRASHSHRDSGAVRPCLPSSDDDSGAMTLADRPATTPIPIASIVHLRLFSSLVLCLVPHCLDVCIFRHLYFHAVCAYVYALLGNHPWGGGIQSSTSDHCIISVASRGNYRVYTPCSMGRIVLLQFPRLGIPFGNYPLLTQLKRTLPAVRQNTS